MKIKLSKWRMIVSGILILIPMFFGLIIFKFLPSEMAIHFGVGGEADGFTDPLTAVVVLPLICFFVHYLCLWLTHKFYKGQGQNPKMMEIMYWILPFTSIATMAMIYSIAFDLPVRLSLIFYLLFAAMFIFIGNYMPKCRRNHMMGVKIKWTLANEENWNMTHRFTGKVWFGCGIACLPCMLLPDIYFIYPLIPLIAVTVVSPLMYSYLYYKKQVKEGTYSDDGLVPQLSKKGKVAVAVIISAILGVTALLMLTGNLEYRYEENAFTLKASYYEDITIRYAEIEKIEYGTETDLGQRLYGFQSLRLSMGIFKCERFGEYTRYTYTGCDDIVVLTLKGRTLVINAEDTNQTKELYENLLCCMEKLNESD